MYLDWSIWIPDYTKQLSNTYFITKEAASLSYFLTLFNFKKIGWAGFISRVKF